MKTGSRLSSGTLASLRPEVARPAYDRAAIRNGVVHLGIGAFHRAHQAVVFDDALAGGDWRWGVVGASLRSSGVRDQLAPQDGLYGLHIRDGGHRTVRIIGAVKEVMVAPEDPEGLVRRMAAPDTRLISLTVTEKGYRLDPVSGTLIEGDPEVAADLKDLTRPRTTPGFLTAALARRRAEGVGPLTVISCDNIPHNGARVRRAVLAMAGHHDLRLRDWIEATCAFPSTMVDRIVPATTPDAILEAEASVGLRDEGLVLTEPFSQWVIEDAFAGERPDFEALGVQVAPSVAPWEDAKLRLLNGAHSTIAYLGGLAGLDFVHQVVAVPVFAAAIERFWDEATTTLALPAGLDPMAYQAALMTRFRNTALQHRVVQIAMDGSQKIPQRLLAACMTRLDRNSPIPALALGVAAWMRWQQGRNDFGVAFRVDDPLAIVTASLLDGTGSPAARVDALLTLTEVFPRRLAADPRFRLAVTDALDALERHGARTASQRLIRPEASAASY